MATGKRRFPHSIDVYTISKTKTRGENVISDKFIGNVPGRIMQSSANEQNFGDQRRGIVTHRFQMRDDTNFFGTGTGIRPEYKFISDGISYDVVSADAVGEGRSRRLEGMLNEIRK